MSHRSASKQATAQMRGRGVAVASALALVIGSAGVAHAQEAGGNLDLNQFRPAMDSRGFLTVNASQPLGHKELSFGLGALDWGYKPLSFQDGANTYEVNNIFAATLIAAFGVKLGGAELEFGASAPLVIMSGDRGPDNLGDPTTPNDDQRFKLEGQGFGNLGVHVKTRFLKTSSGPKIGLGLIASLYLPTVSQKHRWLGEEGMTPQVTVVVDKEFGKRRQLRFALNGGFRYRTKNQSYTDVGVMGAPPTGQTIAAKAEIPFGAALAYAISPQKFDVVGEVIGAVPLAGAENYFPAEAIGGVKLYLARNSFLSLGGGVGITGKGGSPTARGFIGIVFEPNIGDRDGDGFKDDVDKCPDDPEDFDGFQDDDGCPEPDNDRDGILDEDDACPLNPEDKDGVEDDDGCPEGNIGDRDGDGIMDNVDQCPDDPEDFDEFEDADGCPDPDNDQDGILDVDDLCPNDPEDKDDFEDEDGCPDPDNDRDRILDEDDKCPNEPETYNGTEDEDGCPDKGIAVDIGGTIDILENVYFEYDSAVIKPESYRILDAVAAVIEGNPGLQKIEVQGHTDERGPAAYNLDLSQRRANSVRTYLMNKGIAGERLTGEGYGETQPLVRESNERAWEKNRRVAFIILARADD